ncbi:FtsX-like permease family protein [Tepidibacter hydrothermalis]|uniref:ABC3 transporter permease C-terminal domain-containing protein n=1 Tax=Tepidibacter hydrothermalis TaxID=3036126 RepID=A0ABY8E726_9FIRM|nr:FtsX-like permease family protein [Tepidibacter hydrothermalis]WFD08649.1 hypothetical protein P4S50_09570 [Tepidibacter hydrothermalis]
MSFLQFALNNIKRNFRIYCTYYFSSAISVMFFFIFATYVFHPSIVYLNSDPLSWGMVYTQILIFVFLILFVFYSANIILKIRRKDIGILMILGISKTQLKILFFFINMIIGAFSIVTGIIIGLVFTKFFLLLSETIIGTDTLCCYFSIKPIMLTVITFFILFFISSLTIPFFLRMRKVNSLLKESTIGDIEIKFSKVLSILSILLIVIGYFMAAFRKLDTVNDFLYTITDSIGVQILFLFVIITIGTFFFFSQLSIFIIEKLKKKRRFYMKKINIFWISDLAYRIRYNARVLFLVTMLLTVTFSSITSFYAMETIVKDKRIKEYSIAFSYVSLPGNKNEQQHIEEIEDFLKKDGFEFKKNTSVILRHDIDDKQEIYIMKLSEYNEIADVLGMKNVRLKENEAYLIPDKYYYNNNKTNSFVTSKIFYLNNERIILNNVETAEKNIFPIHLHFRAIVVNDYIFKTIQNTSEINTHYSYKISKLKKIGCIAQQLYRKFNKQVGDPFYFFAASYGLETETELWEILLYLSLFTGVMFLSAAGSLLYLRFYISLDQQKKKYYAISKIGITIEEMKLATTIEIGIIIFVPYICACIHTCFFIKTLEIIFLKSFTLQMSAILFAFFVVQFIYFLIIRSRHIRELSRAIL